MIRLLDSNICIALMRGKKPKVTAKFQTYSPDDLVACSIVEGELLVGALRSNSPQTEIAKVEAFLKPFHSHSFDADAARKYDEIRADLETRGEVISDLNMMIAAIAKVHGLILVTHNTREFSRIPGLQLEDWEIL